MLGYDFHGFKANNLRPVTVEQLYGYADADLDASLTAKEEKAKNAAKLVSDTQIEEIKKSGLYAQDDLLTTLNSRGLGNSLMGTWRESGRLSGLGSGNITRLNEAILGATADNRAGLDSQLNEITAMGLDLRAKAKENQLMKRYYENSRNSGGIWKALGTGLSLMGLFV